MFSDLGSFLLSLRNKKLVPIMGRDLNNRLGNKNQLRDENTFHYDINFDASSNKHN